MGGTQHVGAGVDFGESKREDQGPLSGVKRREGEGACMRSKSPRTRGGCTGFSPGSAAESSHLVVRERRVQDADTRC